ncbi:MAG: PP2C family protein-serine/threonine phosphatase [Rhodothermaceae bacterium]|nr:PP2C family protein-serine/threonine phosphatase [Rhodothermaceae bacterium]
MTPISRSRENIFVLLIGIAGLILFVYFFPRVHTSGQLDLSVGRKKALELAREHLEQAVAPGSTTDFSDVSIAFQANNRHHGYFRHIQANSKEQQRITQHSAPYYWNVTYENPEDRSRYSFHLSSTGQLFYSTFKAPDDMPGERLHPHMAERIARNEISTFVDVDWGRYTRIDAQSADQETRVDHTFAWHTLEPVVGEARFRIDATVIGDQLKSWSKTIEFPREFLDHYDARSTAYNLTTVSQIILALIFWVIALFVFAFRFRSDEISIRNGLVIASLMLGALVLFWADIFDYIEQFGPPSTNEMSTIVKYINIGLQIFFTSFGMFFVWTAGESLGRDIWPQKLKTLDGLLARRIFFPDLGRAIMRGFSLGFLQLGIWYLIASFVAKHASVWSIISITELQYLSASSTHFLFIPFTPLFNAISTSLLAVGYAILFALGFFKRITKNTFIAVLITWLVFSGLYTGIAILLPIWISVLLGLCSGLITYLFFLRYDVMTVFFGVFINAFLPGLFLYLHQPNTSYLLTGVIGIILLTGLFGYGLLARLRGVPLNDMAVEPAYARNITERQRMKLELDVARQAQLQMLPQSIPSRHGLDIAAFSEPAKEVGGDYFDFFELDENNLGFAVGDVSGKGISAALYMTMLKGSLQSQAMNQSSPKHLLSHINRTFYKSADKTTYVTLLYGVIDLVKRTLTFSRAGHNPILIYRPQDQLLFFLKPPGLGIGLEKGDIFERILTEESISLHKGDTIVIYTDGLTEARNTKDEEFGEDRLTNLIKSHPIQSAEELLQRIKNGYFSFTGRAEPHDDLTCMVIRMQ